MDKDFADVIQRMVSEQGKEVLVNGKAKVFLGDYCGGRFKKEADVFKKILDANCGELINNADNVPERKQKLIQRLEDDYSLSPKATADYLDLLGLILKGDTKINQTFDNGDVYEGEAVNGIPHDGKVKITSADGMVYEGEAINGLPNGKGKMTLLGGTVIESDWVDGKLDGKVKMTFPDGRVEESYWKDGGVVGGSTASATPQSQTQTYKIGDLGPAGGIVFYDKGKYSYRWRYLEAAPASAEFQDDRHSAEDKCKSLNIGGFSGWRLPTDDELNLMYINLKKNNLGGFSDKSYWSSSFCQIYFSRYQRFSDGYQNASKNDRKISVRPVRAF